MAGSAAAGTRDPRSCIERTAKGPHANAMLRQQLAQYRLFRLTTVRNPSPQRHNRLSQFVIPGAFWTGDGKGFNLVIFFSSLLLVLYLWSPLFCRVLVLSIRQGSLSSVSLACLPA
ncbi:hypothetical protein HDV62DRAFT_6657 [Trichoderma sp. SZMC 28011]